MHPVSYRGPQVGKNGELKTVGGVSTGLAAVNELDPASEWFFMDGNEFRVTSDSKALLELPKDMVEAHYGFCNRVLWAICHGLNQFVEFRDSDYAAYRELQKKPAQAIARLESASATSGRGDYFVQDYQFALLPEMLNEEGIASKLFWHIPFNVEVTGSLLTVAKEMVRGMLGAAVIGFHCQAYADNFVAFVDRHLSECVVDRENLLVFKPGTTEPSRVVVSPLGIDTDNWARMASAKKLESNGKMTFLVVARADYTKGIPELIKAWVIFVQGLPRSQRQRYQLLLRVDETRPGIKPFDDVRKRIIAAYRAAKSAVPGTVVWTEKMSPEKMAVRYAHTDVLLVPAIVDGLNLTAMEFVASQPQGSGAVVGMSAGTGLYATFGKHVIELTPGHVRTMAAQLKTLAKRAGTPEAVEDMAALHPLVRETGEWVADFTSQAA